MKDNIVQDKSYAFSLRIIKLHQFLKSENQYEIASQILRSWTSIGANVEEAIGGQSRRDFLHKLSISYKEARETKYWLRLLKDSEIVDLETSNSYIDDCEELLRILGSIQKSLKANS